MQANADQIMQLSRRRQAQDAGAGRSIDAYMMMPANGFVKCEPQGCSLKITNVNGVGIERNEPVPDLFGTFAESAFTYAPDRKVLKTTFEEGGRNTVRGRF
jgi:hypothetical protein